MKKFAIVLLCIVIVVATGFGVWKFGYPILASMRNKGTDDSVIESLGDYVYNEETTSTYEHDTEELVTSTAIVEYQQSSTTKLEMADLVIDYTAKEKPTKDIEQTPQTSIPVTATTQQQTTNSQTTVPVTTTVTETITQQSQTPPYQPNIPSNEIPSNTPAYENVTTVADLPYSPRMIIVGDKQVRYMSDSVSDNVKDEAVFIYNDGADLQWLSKSGRNRITSTIKEGDIIFIWLGVSDFLDLDDNEQAKRYITFISDMQKSDWKDYKVVFIEIPYQSDLDNRVVDTDVVNTNPSGFPSVDNLSSYNSYLAELIHDEKNIFYMSVNDIIGIYTDGTTVDGSSTFRDKHTGIYFSDGIYQDIYIEIYNQFKSLGGVR